MALQWVNNLMGRQHATLTESLHMAAISKEEQEHLERIRRRWEIYRGAHPKSLKVRRNQDGSAGPDDNVTVNYARDIVDTGVSFLFGEDCEFQIAEDAGKSPNEQWLADCWLANRKLTTLQKHALNGAICGHMFLRVYPPDQMRYGHAFPRVIVLDPATVWPTWDDDDIDIVTRYRIQWNTIDPRTKKPVTRRQLVESDQGGWVITDQQTDPLSHNWVTIDSVRWGWAWCPIAHAQNLPVPNEFWGISDLEDDALDLQRAINFTASNNQKIVRNHAHPKVYITGMTAGQALDMSPDTTIVLPKDASMGQLEMQGDLAAASNHLRWMAQQLSTLNRVPEIALGMTDEPGNLSGVALAIKFKPLLAKTEQKRAIQADLLAEVNRRLFDLAGRGEWIMTQTVWRDPLPKDEKAEREAAEIDHELGVSQETLLAKLGYDPEVEKQRRSAEDAASQALGGRLLDDFVRGGRVDENRVTDANDSRRSSAIQE